MKVEVNKTTAITPKKYPYLAGFPDSGLVVMWIDTNKCIVLESSDNNKDVYIGRIYTSWYESDFQPFNGTITLSND